MIHGGDALVLCPEGPLPVSLGHGAQGHGWFPLSEDRHVDFADIRRASELLQGWINSAKALYPIDTRKMVILGFSQGGVLAYDLALARPDAFAGLVALSSWLPGPLAESIESKEEHSELPILVIHGSKDPLIPIELGEESRDRLLTLGASPVFREFDMQHEIRPDALQVLVQWIEDKVFSVIHLL